ncbi:MAG: hypothetical protein Q4A72_05725 [Bacillota bacterium]|nr:hypothetical protein [Bacillota bacterium]
MALLDQSGEILSSSVIDLNKSTQYTLSLLNTDTNVYAEKVYLLLDGKQYDLNKEDENKKTVLLQNTGKELRLDLEFEGIEGGLHSALVIVEHQWKEEPRVLEEQGYSSFVLSGGKGGGTAIEESPEQVLQLARAEEERMLGKLDRSTDFAVFGEEQKGAGRFEIVAHNFVKQSDSDEMTHYAYLYNPTSEESEYSLYLLSGEDLLSFVASAPKIVLGPGQDAVYRIKVPAERLKDGVPYYFVLLRTPVSESNAKTEEAMLRKETESHLSFSQKFLIRN